MKLITIRNTSIITLLALLLAVSACNNKNDNETSSGGGGSTSTPDTGTSPEAPEKSEPIAFYAGTYIGTGTLTASALGLTESETVPVTIVIDQNGNVTIESGSDLFPNVITLIGNAFTYSQTFNDQQFGSVSCSGTLTLQGSINNSGKLSVILSSKDVSCEGVPGTVSGSITAIKQ